MNPLLHLRQEWLAWAFFYREPADLTPAERPQLPALAEGVLEAVVDAADPEQAARYLRIFFARSDKEGRHSDQKRDNDEDDREIGVE